MIKSCITLALAAMLSLSAINAEHRDPEETQLTRLVISSVLPEQTAASINEALILDDAVPLAQIPQTRTPESFLTPGASALERQVFLIINDVRSDYGLDPLEWDVEVASVARAHSVDMAQARYFNHINLSGQRPADRKFANGLVFRYSGEVIARGFSNPEAVVKAWMDSPSHREAILCDIPTLAGVGVFQNHWTVNFVGMM